MFATDPFSYKISTDYADDCDLGARKAAELISLIRRTGVTSHLGWAVSEMVRAGKFDGVEVGFFDEIARLIPNDNAAYLNLDCRIVGSNDDGNAWPVSDECTGPNKLT